jgi:hypothetical protein
MIGLILTVVLPWVLDTGFWVYDSVQEADLSSLTKKLPDFSNYSLSSWNFNDSSKLLWRVDQESQQQKSSFLRSTPKTPAPTVDPKILADELLRKTFPRFDRTIAVIHVGHTGGRSLMELCPSVSCKARFAEIPDQVQACIQQSSQTTRNTTSSLSSPLAIQAKHYFHLGDIQDEELKRSTSFLLTLRNPVDRMLAIFADSHPLACTNAVAAALEQRKPWGCHTQQYWNMPDTSQYTFYTRCFPKPQPELFAQSILSPWPNTTGTFRLAETRDQQKHDCRWLAREIVSGKRDQISLAPHAFHNYEFYSERALYGTTQEVLAIRMEQEQEDLMTLHNLMGGDPTAIMPQVTEPATPSVTSQAYHKLCCVLYKEIAVYDTLLRRAVNLPQYKKDETIDDLRQKCGIPYNTEASWSTWRADCQNRLEMDELLLTPEN